MPLRAADAELSTEVPRVVLRADRDVYGGAPRPVGGKVVRPGRDRARLARAARSVGARPDDPADHDTSRVRRTLKEIMARLEQSSTRAPMIYQHVTSERDREIAEPQVRG
ncbi:MAG TPA: hypothetical protein VN327_08670 [Pseudonocardiaceae bacterium]|jgi:hypothetical protein|nr:hypothetical protein [Pseudonocardiaceae bacterium]